MDSTISPSRQNHKMCVFIGWFKGCHGVTRAAQGECDQYVAFMDHMIPRFGGLIVVM